MHHDIEYCYILLVYGGVLIFIYYSIIHYRCDIASPYSCTNIISSYYNMEIKNNKQLLFKY